jgi:hypothetical protein
MIPYVLGKEAVLEELEKFPLERIEQLSVPEKFALKKRIEEEINSIEFQIQSLLFLPEVISRYRWVLKNKLEEVVLIICYDDEYIINKLEAK